MHVDILAQRPGAQTNGAAEGESLKRRARNVWATGDFSVVAARTTLIAEQLCEAADVQAGWEVLDVATGSGNGALAAARRACLVTGVDFVPSLLERGRIRARAEHLDVRFRDADAENLPFPDASFDAVLSLFGVMFAPDHFRAAAELVRVCRPGGRIALAAWTPSGFIQESFCRLTRDQQMPANQMPPHLWGDESHLKRLFGATARSMQSTVRTTTFRFPSPEAHVEFFRTYFGPTIKAFEAAGSAGPALAGDLAEMVRRYDRNGGNGGPVAVVGTYLETVIVRA